MTARHATDAPGHDASAGEHHDAPGHDASAGEHHDASDHGDAHGHDDHAHGEEALGPIDTAAWGAGIVGVAIAVLMAACFALATSGLA